MMSQVTIIKEPVTN